MMDKKEALEMLNDGKIDEWNKFRRENSDWIPDLSNSELTVDLSHANLRKTLLYGSDLSGAKLSFQESADWSRTCVDLQQAKIDRGTKFPEGFNHIPYGTIYVSQFQKELEAKRETSIFLSYTSSDREVVMAFSTFLRTKGLHTKIDTSELRAGRNIDEEIVRVMSGCNIILIFFSKVAAKSQWVQYEQQLAGKLELEAQVKGETCPRIIYVLLDDIKAPKFLNKDRLAIVTKGKKFTEVGKELYKDVLKLRRNQDDIDLAKWNDFKF